MKTFARLTAIACTATLAIIGVVPATPASARTHCTSPPEILCNDATTLDELKSIPRPESVTGILVQGGAIEDFSVLKRFPNLTSVGASYGNHNAMSLVDSLTNPKNLLQLKLAGDIKSLDKVASITSLQDLTLAPWGALDLRPLKALTDLRSLNVNVFKEKSISRTIRANQPFSVQTYIGLDGKRILPESITEWDGLKYLGNGSVIGKTPMDALLLWNAKISPGQLTKLETSNLDVQETVRIQDTVKLTSRKSTFTGQAAVGRSISFNPGQSHRASFQWFIAGKAIKGATRGSYKPVASDRGKKLTLRVLWKSHQPNWYLPTTQTFTASNKVIGALTVSSAPKINGIKRVGSTLTSTTPKTKPTATKSSHQWLRSGKNINGATKNKYVLTPADLGKTLSVKIVYKRSGYLSLAKTSSATTKISVGKFAVTKTPRISGKQQTGKTLKASTGTWSAKPTKFSYRWHRNGVPISKATKSTYKVTSRDRGKVLSVKVTGSRSGFTTKTVSSTVR